MFIGRKEELSELERLYSSDKFEFAVIYGRRRVGKTTLIREFCRGKRAFYFVAREAEGSSNLKMAAEEMASQGLIQAGTYFKDWNALLDVVGAASAAKRMILAIDEYPYLAAGEKSISSILQTHIDGKLKDGRLFLILCGSSMSFMENQILGHKSPLYGRRTIQLKVKPFGFFEAREFLSGFSPEEQAALYGATGGVPEYLGSIDNGESMDGNLTRLFFKESGRLYEEPSNLLKQELREPALYNSVIASIAGGASRLNEIATGVGMESNAASRYVNALMSLGILKKETPVSEKPGRRSIYAIADNMFRFWYRFVFPNMSAIEAGAGEVVWKNKAAGGLSQFMGGVFENICLEYLWAMQKKDRLPVAAGRMGRWWGNNPVLKRQDEVDILAIDGDTALLGERKWRSAVSLDVLTTLRERGDIFDVRRRYFYIFAKNDFEEPLLREAARDRFVSLLTLAGMINDTVEAVR